MIFLKLWVLFDCSEQPTYMYLKKVQKQKSILMLLKTAEIWVFEVQTASD